MRYRSLDFPTGSPIVPALPIRRLLPLPERASVRVQVGDRVLRDDVLAEITRADGTADQVRAGFSARVVQSRNGAGITLEGVAAVVHGILGIGDPRTGMLVSLQRGELVAVANIPRGSVVLHPGTASLSLLQRARASGAAGIIAGSASSRDIESFFRVDLTYMLEGSGVPGVQPPLTVVLTEGVGSAVMSTAIHQMLMPHLNQVIYLHGLTDPSQGIRPEIVLSVADSTPQHQPSETAFFSEGARVLIRSGDHGGKSGTIAHLFQRLQMGPNGVLAPAGSVQCDDGTFAVFPLHALDLLS